MAFGTPGAESSAAPCTGDAYIDQFDWEIVSFVVSWHPYGGPPEGEPLRQFGMTPSRLLQRFEHVVTVALGQLHTLDKRQAKLLAQAGALCRGYVTQQPVVSRVGPQRSVEAPPVLIDGRWVRHAGGVMHWRSNDEELRGVRSIPRRGGCGTG